MPNVADEILNYWKENNIFEKSITTRDDNKPFIFFEGPPSANGLPGIHHAMGRTIKDIFCRYKTLKGFQVKRKAGWDTHGLPVELGVEKELGITKEDIGTKITIKPYITPVPPNIINVSIIKSNQPYSIPKNSLGKNKRILFISGIMYIKIGLENSLIWYPG